MSTAIEWTDETWNPVVGCTKVSQGCKHCYAKTLHDKRHKAALAGNAVHPQYLQPFETVQLMPERLTQPLHWQKPRRCFVNSVSDLFHEDVPFEFLDRVFAVMALARAHTFQVLTKRPARMLDYFAKHVTRHVWAAAASEFSGKKDGTLGTCDAAVCNTEWPLPNVWLGVSVENQEAADERIPLLVQTPAAVRFLSCEPLLGPLDLSLWLEEEGYIDDQYVRPVDWVIVGGESGPAARPCDVSWITAIVADCNLYGVPCFVKQLGKWIAGPHAGFCVDRWLFADGSIFVPPILGERAFARPVAAVAFSLGSQKHGDPYQWPRELRVREFPGEVPA